MENQRRRYKILENCIEISEDAKLKARAYVLIQDLYEEQGRDLDQREILNEARNALPMENQMLILQRLVEVDLKLAGKSGENSYLKEASDALLTVIDQGWDSYDTYNNLVILMQKQGNLSDAETYAKEMLEKYGEDYNIYKRLAFLEIDKQEQKQNRQRDYRSFEEYYEKAKKWYQEEQKENDTDSEVELLNQVYQQVVSGGWLSE